MKRVKMSFLALAAIVGVGAAFTTKAASKTVFSYGITGLTAGGHGYNIVAFDHDLKKCNNVLTVTCAITSATARTSPVATNASGITKHPGQYVNQ